MMKRFLMICAAALVACGLAGAQTSTDTIRVHFEYPVIVSGTELPAGNYTIQITPSSGANVLLTLRSESGRQSMLLVNPVRAPRAGAAGGTVVLSRQGEQYRLEQVWMTEDLGFELIR